MQILWYNFVSNLSFWRKSWRHSATTPSTYRLVPYKPRCHHALQSGSFQRKTKGRIYGTKEARLPLCNRCRERQTFPQEQPEYCNYENSPMQMIKKEAERRSKSRRVSETNVKFCQRAGSFCSDAVEQGKLPVADLLVMTWETLKEKIKLPNSNISQPIRRVTASKKESNINCWNMRCVDAVVSSPEATVNKHGATSLYFVLPWSRLQESPVTNRWKFTVRHVEPLHSLSTSICEFRNVTTWINAVRDIK